MTIIGIDAHKRTHTLVAIDSGGRKLGQNTVEASSRGHAEAMRWATVHFGTELVWAVEDNRSVTALLERELMGAGPWPVVRCPPYLMARNRTSAREWGKSDPIDAWAVARVALREPNLPRAFHDPVSWELKLLVNRREDLVGQRVAITNRLFWRLHYIDPDRPEPKRLNYAVRRKALVDYLTEQSGLQAELALGEVTDIGWLSESIDALTKRITRQVTDLGSSLLTVPGCAELTAAKLIAEAANVDRFPNDSAFAAYAGIAPIPQWSGTTRGRLRACPYGNRQLNAAIHRIAVVQTWREGPGKDYYQRRRAEGDSSASAIRHLKRRLCRVIFNRLRTDFKRRSNHRV